jgi:hypothetical protein
MFKTSHLGISKFDFLSLYSFCTKNPNRILPKITCRFENNVIMESDKIKITKNFLYERKKKKNQNLIYLNENF